MVLERGIVVRLARTAARDENRPERASPTESFPPAMSSTAFDPVPVTLQGEHLRLVPLTEEHAEGLLLHGREPAIWDYMLRGPLVSLEDARSYIRGALADRSQVPFAILDPGGEQVLGTTRYMDIQRENRSLEIGHTWLGAPFRRSAVNTECKLLLLEHAFERLGAVRVQLKTDGRNLVSQRAIERLGARREGVLRNHRIVRDGYVRDTVMYALVPAEWPLTKARLRGFLGRG